MNTVKYKNALPMPIGYHSLYCDGLSPESRFPRDRYPKLKQSIVQHPDARLIQWFSPKQASLEELYDIHAPEYVDRFVSGTLTPKEQRQIGLRPWNPEIIPRTLHLTGGTIEAVHACIESNGYAGNLAGGTHHAYRDHGAGYCIFNDIAIAAMQAVEMGLERITVLDLDVHQGDGTASICKDMSTIQTISVHCAKNYPFKKQTSDIDIALPADTGDTEFLIAVETAISAMVEFSPGLLIYQAGVDPLSNDRLGKMNISRMGLRKRNKIVFDCVDAMHLPCLVLMGGGYAEPIEPTVECLSDLFLEAARRHLKRQDTHATV